MVQEFGWMFANHSEPEISCTKGCMHRRPGRVTVASIVVLDKTLILYQTDHCLDDETL
jgi:hypothetical protein